MCALWVLLAKFQSRGIKQAMRLRDKLFGQDKPDKLHVLCWPLEQTRAASQNNKRTNSQA